MPKDPDELLDELTEHLPDFGNRFSTMGFTLAPRLMDEYTKPGFEKIQPQLIAFCDHATEINRSLGNGYTLSFSPHFTAEDFFPFRGLNLVIQNRNGEQVGGLTFKIGHPIEITTVQGNGSRPREFYQKTGKFFYEVLIDQLNATAGRHIRLEKDPAIKPSVIFNFSRRPPKTLFLQILRKYCPRSTLQMEKLHERKPSRDAMRVRPKFLAKHQRTTLRK